MSSDRSWTIKRLHQHLQWAVDLEFWTIPYYMSALYSVRDPADTAPQYIQSVIYQEMLHLQLAANIGNAYGLKVTFPQPFYIGQHIPHLDFNLDHPDPRLQFSPFSAEIGALDRKRVNGFCLVEYPEWLNQAPPHLQDDMRDYPSIGAFYDALRVGAETLADHIAPDPKTQINFFQRYYLNGPQLTVVETGRAGWPQVKLMIECITDQGEGGNHRQAEILALYQNTADDIWPSVSHYEKFIAIWGADSLPESYPGTASPGAGGQKAQQILSENFERFRATLERLFAGEDAPNFFPDMVALGGNILNCWKHGAVPRYSPHLSQAEHREARPSVRAFPAHGAPAHDHPPARN
jgi:hypothetical protein